MKKLVLIAIAGMLVSCTTQQIVYKTRVLIPDIPCVEPLAPELIEYDESMTDEQWDATNLSNLDKQKTAIEMWERYKKCVDNSLNIYRQLQGNIKNIEEGSK